MRKIKYSLLAAAGVSVITAAVCFASAPMQKNASSLVYFPDGNDGTALLRDAISADMNKTAQQSGTPADELERSLSVEPFGSGAEIVLSGLKSTDNAPVILASALGNAVKSGRAEFDVISYCDMAENVQFPSLPVSFSAGIAGGLAVYAAMSIAEALKKKKIRCSLRYYIGTRSRKKYLSRKLIKALRLSLLAPNRPLNRRNPFLRSRSHPLKAPNLRKPCLSSEQFSGSMTMQLIWACLRPLLLRDWKRQDISALPVRFPSRSPLL
ncbi:MAG: hypothetical protein ACLSHR_01920 [Oscillospiraceae bacterium]